MVGTSFNETNHTAGCRVEVNLGKNKKYAGIVKRLYNDKPEFFEPKEILNLLDVEPVVFEQHCSCGNGWQIITCARKER